MRAETRSGRGASQSEKELASFINLLKEEGVTSYLEIGVRHGDTFFEVMKSLPAGSIGVAVDLPGGKWGTPTSVSALQDAAEELRQMGYLIHVFLGDSKSESIIQGVRQYALFDACFIDGDHRYESVYSDWVHYGSMSRIVGFHDINGEGQAARGPQAWPVEVPRLWQLLRSDMRHIEFIDPDYRMGIGVLWR